MDLIQTTYFGWNGLAHAEACPNPVWDDADILHTEGLRPGVRDDDHHTCEHADCTHGDTFPRVQLRLLCRDCETVHTISGDSLTHVLSHTSATGWGQRPRQFGAVWLWPGRPVIEGGDPIQYLVTRQPQAITEATLYGIVTGYRDAQGTPLWIAGAVPDEDGAHYVSGLRWRHSSRGLAALEDAADWIAEAETAPQRTLVVAV